MYLGVWLAQRLLVWLNVEAGNMVKCYITILQEVLDDTKYVNVFIFSDVREVRTGKVNPHLQKL